MNISQEQYNKLPAEYKKYFEPMTNKHCCVKPVHLMSWLVRLVSKDGDTVLDPFCGSGTTGIACKMLGRKFIGIEISPEYFEIAKKRIENTTQDMFVGLTPKEE